jgi:hypothetical protein
LSSHKIGWSGGDSSTSSLDPIAVLERRQEPAAAAKPRKKSARGSWAGVENGAFSSDGMDSGGEGGGEGGGDRDGRGGGGADGMGDTDYLDGKDKSNTLDPKSKTLYPNLIRIIKIRSIRHPSLFFFTLVPNP